MVFDVFIFLAQSSTEGSSTFQGELVRLLAVLCVLTVVWLGVMYLLYRRTVESRRREREGLPPLPGLLEAWMQWFSGSSRPTAAPGSSSALMPDLDMLTGNLPQPNLADMLGGNLDTPEPVDLAEEFALPPVPVVDEPDYPAEALAATFALDPMPQEEMIPVEMEDYDEMPAPPDSIELLRVWRDLSDGTLIIEIGGQRFTSVGELQQANLDRRFVNVVRDLTTMLRAPAQPPPAAPPKPAPPPASPPAEAPDPPAKKPAPPMSDELPSMSPGTMFKQMGRVAMGYKPEPIEETPLLSIPDQIEQVLQRHLADQPEFAGRSIHVRPSPFGGVRIEVDGEFFDGVGDVTDDRVRALIQTAVREWEQGQ